METTLDAQLDNAVNRLPPVRRAIYKRLLKSAEVRADVCDVLLLKLQSDSAAMALVPSSGQESFTATTPFSIDPENLEKWLAIIVKYLPMVLDILFKFFV